MVVLERFISWIELFPGSISKSPLKFDSFLEQSPRIWSAVHPGVSGLLNWWLCLLVLDFWDSISSRSIFLEQHFCLVVCDLDLRVIKITLTGVRLDDASWYFQ